MKFFQFHSDFWCDRTIIKMSEKLKELILDNLEFYQKNQSKGFEIQQSLGALYTKATKLHELNIQIEGFAGAYDLDQQSPGNGFRNFVHINDTALKRIYKIVAEIKEKREKFFFRKGFYAK